ncbi:MAG: Clp protease ClpP, partial [Clostridia bacterium]|nr:Clp protease ClpP [Clostridia bacterium]
MNKFWQFQNAAPAAATLLLYGEIASSTWWGDEVTARSFAADLAALGPVEEITVRINSGGGDV